MPTPRRAAVVDAAAEFPDALKGVVDPQEKRRRIGHAFIDVFRAEARSIKGAHFLAQGTLYPDVIESGGAADGPTATIKIHHNVGGLPRAARLRADRAAPATFSRMKCRLATELGLPDNLVRPPPAPGLRAWPSGAWAK